MKKLFFLVCASIGCITCWFVYSELYRDTAQTGTPVVFTVEPGESVLQLSEKLEQEHVIRYAWLFRVYLSLKNIDTVIQAGTYTVQEPITLQRVADVLRMPQYKTEREITIIPGWTLRDVAEYFEREGIASAADVYMLLGMPAEIKTLSSFTDAPITKDKPSSVSYEGYLAPDTFRVFSTASLQDIVQMLVDHRNAQFTEQMYADIAAARRTPFEILTLASLLEREVQHKEDMAKVADIFWKRNDAGWPLQSDASVKYIHGLNGSVFTSAKDRDDDSLWNTYKHKGLPYGPISTPSLSAIMAAIYPERNEYWYFLTTLDTGEVKYARTLDEHNVNVAKYLR